MGLLNLFFSVFLIISSSTSYAQKPLSNLPQCDQNQRFITWTNCFGEHSFVSGDSYSGEWRDGKYHGQGVLIFKNGNRYRGGFKDGKYDGVGVSSYSNGEKYEGNFRDGVYSGHGKYTFSDGSVYVGDFKDGQHTDKKRVFASREKIKQDQVLEKEEISTSQSTPESPRLPPIAATSAQSSSLQSSVTQPNIQASQIFTPPATPLFTPGKRIALVIGNSSYKVRPLLNPRKLDKQAKGRPNAKPAPLLQSILSKTKQDESKS